MTSIWLRFLVFGATLSLLSAKNRLLENYANKLNTISERYEWRRIPEKHRLKRYHCVEEYLDERGDVNEGGKEHTGAVIPVGPEIRRTPGKSEREISPGRKYRDKTAADEFELSSEEVRQSERNDMKEPYLKIKAHRKSNLQQRLRAASITLPKRKPPLVEVVTPLPPPPTISTPSVTPSSSTIQTVPYFENATSKTCSRIRRLASAFGISDASIYARQNCKFLQIFAAGFTCEQIIYFVDSCYKKDSIR